MHSKIAVVVVALMAACTAPESHSELAQEANNKVTLCHVPSNNPGNAHTIQVGQQAVDAHLAHGDYLGACVGCTPGTTQACYTGPAGSNGVGACHGGTQTCGPLGFGACLNEVTPEPEICGDGIDNDCDALVDEGCICAPGTSTACYGGPPGSAGVGTCAAGVQFCNSNGSGYGPCVGAVEPAPEACGDGLDTDCDGQVDEGCVCAPGSAASCYDGPAGTSGVGTCMNGTQVCDSAGTGYGACTGSVTPQPELCGNGLDDDCDGVAEDGCVCAPATAAGCYTGPPGTEGIGVCAPGVQTCNATGTGYGACLGAVTPTAEVCGDSLDNDCDGVVDDGCVCTPNTTSACYSGSPDTEGVGTCASGSRACSADGTGYGACTGEVLPAAEVCGDGLDNDCDGAIDDGCVCTPSSVATCYGGPPGTANVGVCSVGTQTCNPMGSGYGACVGDVQPSAEVCGDALDNDCDGAIDEGCIGHRAWNDLSCNGIQNAGEPGLGGVIFLLRTAPSGALVQVAITDVLEGTFYFSNVPAGSYYIEAQTPAGFGLTASDSGGNDDLDSDFDVALQATPSFVFSGNTIDVDAGFCQI